MLRSFPPPVSSASWGLKLCRPLPYLFRLFLFLLSSLFSLGCDSEALHLFTAITDTRVFVCLVTHITLFLSFSLSLASLSVLRAWVLRVLRELEFLKRFSLNSFFWGSLACSNFS